MESVNTKITSTCLTTPVRDTSYLFLTRCLMPFLSFPYSWIIVSPNRRNIFVEKAYKQWWWEFGKEPKHDVQNKYTSTKLMKFIRISKFRSWNKLTAPFFDHDVRRVITALNNQMTSLPMEIPSLLFPPFEAFLHLVHRDKSQIIWIFLVTLNFAFFVLGYPWSAT